MNEEKPGFVQVLEDRGYEFLSRRYGVGGWFFKNNDLYKRTATQYWAHTAEGNLRDGRVRSWARLTKITRYNYLSHYIPPYIYKEVIGRSLR